MKMYAAVRNAVNLVIKTNYANHTFTDYHIIRQQVYSWYENSDCVDPEVLAACALSYGYWSPGDTYDMMLKAHEYWFPHHEEDFLPIEEIEMMQHTEVYW